MISKFTIYGERCSGTNFLMHAIQDNFELEFTTKYAWKHFFGFYNFENNEEENNTLFIGIIRNPIEWINSFKLKMHHIPDENKQGNKSFLFNRFYSIYEDTKKEILEDRHMITKERYHNIFELRKVKNDFLVNHMQKLVKNYLLIRYEDLRDNYNNVLDFFKIKFGLKMRHSDYVKIDTYKGSNNYLYFKKNVILRKDVIDLINNNVDKEQEKSLGYL